jgi:glycosyltransferase involved in cell wall biosynthesis
MRIGIDATCWSNVRGYGRYTREIVTAMAPLAGPHELCCFLDPQSAACFTLSGPGVRPVVVDQDVAPTVAAESGGSRSPRDMLRLTGAVRRARLDAFYSPSVYGYFPLPLRLPAVVTVHDAIAERFPAMTLPTRRDRLFWQLKVRLALWQARLVLTVSDYAAADVAQALGIPRDRLRVTLEGVADAYRPSTPADIRAAAARAGSPGGARWLMYVGGFGPHKRVDLLVRAHAAVAKKTPDRPLLLVLGGPKTDAFHQDMAAITSAIGECGTADLIRWIGYQPDEELRHLHSGAVALALPSMAEGFGLPAVEAAACGTPVIATTASPLPQLLAGGGVFVAPGDLPGLERAIERLVSDEPSRQSMGQCALAGARALSWTRSAQVALDAIVETASIRRGAAGGAP